MTYISWSSDFSSFIFCCEKHFSFIGKAQFRQARLSCDSSYLPVKSQVMFHGLVYDASWFNAELVMLFKHAFFTQI